jgi:cytochrome c biogenesis protein CcdA
VSTAAFALAYSAGVLAAFNPCGSAMLPGWIGFFLLAEEREGIDFLARLLRAIVTALALTLGLVMVFAVVGLAITAGLGAIHSVLPIAIVILGVILAAIGALVWRRGDLPGLHIPGPTVQRRRTVRAMVTFGAAYGIAALSCALPIFLISVGAVHGASWTHRLLGTAGFTAGMASVLALITVATTFADGLAAQLIAIRRYTPRVSAVLLIAAGAWTIYSELPLAALDLHLTEPSTAARVLIAAALTLTAAILVGRPRLPSKRRRTPHARTSP